MYDNIGGKIKGLAKFFFVVGLIGCIVGGAMMISIGVDMNDSSWRDDSGNGLIYSGVFTMILGPIFAWLSTLVLYGFGEIIEKLCDIEKNTRGEKHKKEKRKTGEKTVIGKSKMNEEDDRRETLEDVEYMDIVCPNCGESLSFEKNTKDFQCPFCYAKFTK